MRDKKWLIKVTFTSATIVGFIGSINFIIDPFQQYRISTIYPIHYSNLNSRYINAGLAKRLKYDSIVLGTSMTENFIISEVQDILKYNKVVKLCIPGGSAKEQSITLETAIKNNDNLKNVLWGLDLFAFKGSPSRLSSSTFPKELYDSNFVNDYSYLLSLDTLTESVIAISTSSNDINSNPLYDYNTMYQWQHIENSNFTLEHFVNSWKNRNISFDIGENSQKDFLHLKRSFDENFLPLIKNNTNINFIIFFPPYSILTFKLLEERDSFYDALKFKQYIFEQISGFSNVHIYDFQIEKKITHNFIYYKDMSHYHQRINTTILHEIEKHNYLLNEGNYIEYSEVLERQVKEFNIHEYF